MIILKQGSQTQSLLRFCHVDWRTFSSTPASTHYMLASISLSLSLSLTHTHTLFSCDNQKRFQLFIAKQPLEGNILAPPYPPPIENNTKLSFTWTLGKWAWVYSTSKNSSLDSIHIWLLLQISTRHLLFLPIQSKTIIYLYSLRIKYYIFICITSKYIIYLISAFSTGL